MEPKNHLFEKEKAPLLRSMLIFSGLHFLLPVLYRSQTCWKCRHYHFPSSVLSKVQWKNCQFFRTLPLRSHPVHPVIQNFLVKRRYDFKQTDPIKNGWNLDISYPPGKGSDVPPISGSSEHHLTKQFSSDQICTALPYPNLGVACQLV